MNYKEILLGSNVDRYIIYLASKSVRDIRDINLIDSDVDDYLVPKR